MIEDPKKVDILGVPFYVLTWENSLLIFEALLLAGNQYQIAKANPEFVMIAQEDPEDLEILQKTALNTADGIGILWAATFLSLPPKGYLITLIQFWKTLLYILVYPKAIKKVIPERIGGVEHVVDECKIAAKHGIGVFMLGASDKAREGAGLYLLERIPDLKILGSAGSFNPFEDQDQLVEAINKSGAGFLIVCFGHPLQEKWIFKNLKKMPGIRVADGEGGTFDYMARLQIRAPSALQKTNLEWFWRLITQKNRLQKIKRSVPDFIRAVFKAKLAQSRLKKKILTIKKDSFGV